MSLHSHTSPGPSPGPPAPSLSLSLPLASPCLSPSDLPLPLSLSLSLLHSFILPISLPYSHSSISFLEFYVFLPLFVFPSHFFILP